MEDTFPWAFIDRVNQLGNGEVVAEAVQINELKPRRRLWLRCNYRQNFTRCAFYRAYLKMQGLTELTSSTILLVECRRKIL